jgi:excisionase family DNA binding protein
VNQNSAGQDDLPKLLTVAEMAAMLRVSSMTIYRLINAGELRTIRIGRSIRIPNEVATEYLANLHSPT